MKKHYVFDVDNTLLSYTDGFKRWCIEHKGLDWVDSHDYSLKSYLPNISCDKKVQELVREFNLSDSFGMLGPNNYTVALVQDLLDKDFEVGVMSSFMVEGGDQKQVEARTKNLINVFGNVFHSKVYLPLGGDKTPHLGKLCDSYDQVVFVDDNPKDLNRALSAGYDNLTVVAWEQSYNKDVEADFRINEQYFLAED